MTRNEAFRVPVKLFELGRVVATRGALDACMPEYLRACLARHLRGDWGVVEAKDGKANFRGGDYQNVRETRVSGQLGRHTQRAA
jgi:hypothetical protein